MSPLGERVLRAATALLPPELRRRVGEDIVATACDRAADASSASARRMVWIGETAGVCLAALRARWPSAWERRTARLVAAHVVIESQFDTRRSLVDQLMSDVRFAGRALRRRPLMLGTAIASVALGIGASVAMFSVVDTVLLRPLAFTRPDELAAVYVTWPQLRANPTFAELAARGTFSWAELQDVQTRQTVFDGIGGYDNGWSVLSGT